MQNRFILQLSLPLTVLVILVSCIGLFTPDFYASETLNWQAQSLGQDMIDLFFIAPCLLISSILAYRNNRSAMMIWGGVALYLTYTFILYCFDVHFNKLFLAYCLDLGLSFYSLIYFLFIQLKTNRKVQLENKFLTTFIGLYFILLAVLFYMLWLSEIIPAILQKTIPKSVTDAGLFTNGVQVLDLAILLPAIFITGFGLLKRKSFGYILTPVILTFFILMDITIGLLAFVLKTKGLEGNLFLTAIMAVLALFSLALLVLFLKNLKSKPVG